MNRTRNFVAIGYPESLKENWQDILNESHVPCIISPLHNLDVDINGEIKKEHYHIELLFDSVKTLEQAQKIFDSIGATKCQPINSLRGQTRYLCHLDDLDKHPYDTSEVVCLNGADFYGIIELPTNKYLAIREMKDFVEFNNIVSFSDLFCYCADNNEVWFRSLCDNSAFIMKEYLKARSWKDQVNSTTNYRNFSMPPKNEKEVKEK